MDIQCKSRKVLALRVLHGHGSVWSSVQQCLGVLSFYFMQTSCFVTPNLFKGPEAVVVVCLFVVVEWYIRRYEMLRRFVQGLE